MLEDAIKRYYGVILKSISMSRLNRLQLSNLVYQSKSNKTWKQQNGFQGYLDVLHVDLMSPCEYMPHENMDEACGFEIVFSSYALALVFSIRNFYDFKCVH